MKHPAVVGIAFVSALVTVAAASAQQRSDADVRARELAASFATNTDLVKTRGGATRGKYKDVRTELVVRSSLQSLSGTYKEPGFGFMLRLRVRADGRVEGSGEDPVRDGVTRAFTIANGRVSGPLLSGTKVYRNGRTQPLEGVFMNKTVRESPSDRGTTEFGLGMTGTFDYAGFSVPRLFFERIR